MLVWGVAIVNGESEGVAVGHVCGGGGGGGDDMYTVPCLAVSAESVALVSTACPKSGAGCCS